MAWDPTQPPNNGSLLSAPIRANFAALAPLMQGPGGTPFPLLAPDGSAAAPSYSFAASPTTGLYHAANQLLVAAAGVRMLTIGSGGTYLDYGFLILRDLNLGINTGVKLLADGDHVLGLRNLANAQTLRVYETIDGGGNGSWLDLQAASTMLIMTRQQGTGVARGLGIGTMGSAPLTFRINNTTAWYLDVNSFLYPGADNTYDLGGPSLRPRSLFAGTSLSTPRIDLPVGAAPATPAAGIVSVYAKADKKAYQKDDAGLETPLGGGGGGVAAIRLPLEQATLPDGSAGNVPPEFIREKSTGVLSGAPSPTRTYARFAGDAAAVAESLMWSFLLPSNYGSGGTIRLKWKAAVATTGAVIWKAGAAPVTDGSTDDDSVAFTAVATAAASNAPATQGQSVEVTLTLTTTGFAALRWVTVFIARDPVAAADTMTGTGTAGDAILMGAQFEYTPA